MAQLDYELNSDKFEEMGLSEHLLYILLDIKSRLDAAEQEIETLKEPEKSKR